MLLGGFDPEHFSEAREILLSGSLMSRLRGVITKAASSRRFLNGEGVTEFFVLYFDR